jgi:hypothetical protein
MSIFLILPAPYQPRGKSSISDLSDVWDVDIFFKTGSGSLALVAAHGARGLTFKKPRTESVNGGNSSLG